MHTHSQRKNKYTRNKGEYDKVEDEFKFARWFWRQAVPATWHATKLLVTFAVIVFICIVGYVTITSAVISPVYVVIGMGLLLSVTLLANMDLRNGILRLLPHKRNYENTRLVTTYDNLKFYFLRNHEEILFLENGRDLTAVGLFKLKAIPLIIKGNFERFIRSLYQQQIPVYWTYVQAPVDQGTILDGPAVSEQARRFYADQPPYEFESRMESRNGMWVARLLFGTRRTVSATFNIEAKRLQLYQDLSTDLFKIQTAFVSAYPHTVLEPLHGKELEKALSISITGGGMPAFF